VGGSVRSWGSSIRKELRATNGKKSAPTICFAATVTAHFSDPRRGGVQL